LLANHTLTGLAGQPSVQFRMVFTSDSLFELVGFAFDDFGVTLGPAPPVTTASPTTSNPTTANPTTKDAGDNVISSKKESSG